MTDYEKAIAEFEATRGATVCVAITSAKVAKAVPRYTAKQADADKDAAERAERRAENTRYDAEGVYIVNDEYYQPASYNEHRAIYGD